EVGELIDQASFKGSIRQPFSVTALRFETATAVGAMGTGVLVVANRTELENDPTNVSVESLTDAISLPEKSFDLPPIAPGSSAEIPFEYSPQVTAGGNQPVRIQLTADNLAGGNIQMIATSTIKVNRKGSLQLCLQNCN